MEAMSITSVPGLHGLCRALGEEHVFHDRAVFQHAHHHLGGARGLRRAGVHGGAKGGHAFGLVAAAVPHVHLVARLAQAARHGKAHEANAQYCNFHSLLLPLLTA
jgi:hypothetical protein